MPIKSTPYDRQIQVIVIHHMGDGLPPSVSILQRWNPDGYDYPEYDFGIEADGTIRDGRPLTIQGAHCLTDKPPYSARGSQWFNQNAIGIGLAGDFTEYPMPQAQFNALVVLVKRLMGQYGLTLDNVYPHGQVTYTDCPGCVYDKVPELAGEWNYNSFEQAMKGGEDEMDVCVIYFTAKDYSVAEDIAELHGGCAMFCRNGSAGVHADAQKATKVYNVGGPKLGWASEVYLSGNTALDTLNEVAKAYVAGQLA